MPNALAWNLSASTDTFMFMAMMSELFSRAWLTYTRGTRVVYDDPRLGYAMRQCT